MDKLGDQQWVDILEAIVARYRRDHPHGGKTDTEICHSFMERLVKSGVVERNAKGKFILPSHLVGGTVEGLVQSFGSDLN